MPLKTGSYTMTFMIDTGVLPFPITTDASLSITETTPQLMGTISVPKLGINNAAIVGNTADNSQGIATFSFSTNPPTNPNLDAYGMQFLCGTEMKLIGGTNITTSSGLPGSGPGEDACWVATHSGAGDGDDDDDKDRKGKYGR